MFKMFFVDSVMKNYRNILTISLLCFIFSSWFGLYAEEKEDALKVDSVNSVKNENSDEKWWYLQPNIGFLIGYPVGLTLNAGLDFNVRVVEMFHIGFNAELRLAKIAPKEETIALGVPLKLRPIVPISVDNKFLKICAFWFAGGINLIFDVPVHEDASYFFQKNFIYGFGIDLIFKNNLVLRLGAENYFSDYYPNLLVALGYRF